MNVLLALLKPLEAPAQRDELKVAVIVSATLVGPSSSGSPESAGG